MKTILLIEDNEIIRENTAEILEMTGYLVRTAANGKAGVQLALEDRPDLVICDIMMPELDGYGVLHIFNKNPELAGIPFIFLTAKTERVDFRKGMELGADDYLTKPFDESELLSAVESRFSRFEHLKPDHEHHGNDAGKALSDAYILTGDLESLTADRKIHAVPKKQYLYFEGDTPIRLCFLRAGRVKTFRTDPNGKEFITGLYHAGDFFGYSPLLEDKNYFDSAITLEESELIYIPADDFRKLLLANPEVNQQFLRLIASRVAEQEVQLSGMAYGSLRRRVADTLLRLHEQEPDHLIQLSRADLAAMVGTATESLIRTLSEFKQDGLVEVVGSGDIRVVKPDLMRQAKW
ncbi:response regulator [Salmonirosea aquatica]|uniref:Response regulator n=1 Tax=Salmonirosea aquatica TaxID=2654236 RepID=A0A7C9BFB2_9BACT|nr:response regulator [Cytophagaceae bacterium SJW1-29]